MHWSRRSFDTIQEIPKEKYLFYMVKKCLSLNKVKFLFEISGKNSELKKGQVSNHDSHTYNWFTLYEWHSCLAQWFKNNLRDIFQNFNLIIFQTEQQSI